MTDCLRVRPPFHILPCSETAFLPLLDPGSGSLADHPFGELLGSDESEKKLHLTSLRNLNTGVDRWLIPHLDLGVIPGNGDSHVSRPDPANPLRGSGISFRRKESQKMGLRMRFHCM
jgi:hypothetical protein